MSENPPDTSAPAAAQAAQQHYSPGLLDLGRQLQNMQLMRPLFNMEANKLRVGEESRYDRGLLQRIDTQYLALAALDQMMETTLVSYGCSAEELIAGLSEVASQMDPSLNPAQLRKAADYVIGCLDNRSNQYKEFGFEYFDAPSRGMRTARFRLVSYEPDTEDVYRYKPTPEGYLVYLGMLDLPAEDAQELVAKMLDLMVSRGKFADALQIAQRARTLSIQYRQGIRDKLHQAYRSPGSVSWSRDMAEGMKTAREHVRQRQAEDQRMEESVREAAVLATDERSRGNLVNLIQVLERASVVRSQLVGEITGSQERFLEAQRSVFRARKPSGYPDLESRLLPQLLCLDAQTLSVRSDEVLSVLYGPEQPKLFDYKVLRSVLLERTPDEELPELDDGEMLELPERVLEFPDALVAEVEAWLQERFAAGRILQVDQLIDEATAQGRDRTWKRCLVMAVYDRFTDSPAALQGMVLEVLPDFIREEVAGNNLRFTPPKGNP